MFVVTGMELEKEAFRAFKISQVSYIKQRVCQRRNPFLICPLLFLTQVSIFFMLALLLLWQFIFSTFKTICISRISRCSCGNQLLPSVRLHGEVNTFGAKIGIRMEGNKDPVLAGFMYLFVCLFVNLFSNLSAVGQFWNWFFWDSFYPD